MAVYKQKGSKRWWYKFNWNGEPIRESTKQTNKRVAEQMEAAHKAALAKGEVGIRERKVVPTLSEFADKDFLPFIESRFANKPKTLEYYKTGLKRLQAFSSLAKSRLDAIAPARSRISWRASEPMTCRSAASTAFWKSCAACFGSRLNGARLKRFRPRCKCYLARTSATVEFATLNWPLSML